MRWIGLIAIFIFSFQVFGQECLTFPKEKIVICIGDKVRHLPSFGKPMVEVMGFSKGDPEGKVLILKTGRRIKRMNYATPQERLLCNGCEPAGLGQIRVGPEAYQYDDEVITPPDRQF